MERKTSPIRLPAKEVQELLCMNAPMLTGMKPSAIINVSMEELKLLREALRGSRIRVLLLSTGERATIFLYRLEMMAELWEGAAFRQALEMIEGSYRALSAERSILLFRKRFRDFKERGSAFPHELGLLLGYPPEDVLAFIAQNGEHAVYTGYWKVYHDLAGALKIFRSYDISISNMRMMLRSGVSLSGILAACDSCLEKRRSLPQEPAQCAS